MITLATLLIIWGCISTYRIYNISKEKEKEFNPFNGTFVDHMGFLLGTAALIMSIFITIVLICP